MAPPQATKRHPTEVQQTNLIAARELPSSRSKGDRERIHDDNAIDARFIDLGMYRGLMAL
jgi:hypothetical protein